MFRHWSGRRGISPQAAYAAVAMGHPVQVGVSFDLKAHAADDYTSYDGKRIIYHGPWEHTVIVTGIDSAGVRVNDPDRTQYGVSFAQFETMYAQYDHMAVVFG
jgi:hypothetical protein